MSKDKDPNYVVKLEKAIKEKYGEDGKNGVAEITLKK